MKTIDLVGKRFGKLVVLDTARDQSGRLVCKCYCECGSIKLIRSNVLTRRGQKDCRSCATFTVSRDESEADGSPERRVWQNMIRRCEDEFNPSFARYGERGIQVCLSWRVSYRIFLRDMGRRPSAKHTLDRINNDGNYEPSNCRWATAKQQNRNRSSNLLISINGVSKTLVEWSSDLGIRREVLSARFKNGERGLALTRPVRSWIRRAP